MKSLVADIWNSLLALPRWVAIWVFGVLVPTNAAAILFVGSPLGNWIAAMAIGALLPNAFFLLRDRGFGKVMSLSHLVLWPPLVVLAAGALLAGGTGPVPAAYLVLLIVVDLTSIGFDLRDGWLWWKGDRRVPGR